MNEPRRTDLASPAAASDAAIIERSVAIPECFAEIFDRHAADIYRYAARRLGQQAAADVMSEVFLAAFRNRRRYDTGRDDARPWLYGIAVNVIRQFQRAQRRYARVLAAAAVLLRAARATAAVPDLHPRADQFIYTESVSRYVTQHDRLFVTRAWLSADGWHGGLILQRWASGKRWYHGFGQPDCLTLPHSNWNYKANCPLPAAYVTHLPRTVKAMKRYLLGSGATGQGTPRAVGAIMAIVSDYQYLVPHRGSALMFQALSQFKGIRVIDHATTLAGRKGIGVAAYDPSRGTLDELLFDPKTYLYIGDSEIALNSTYMPKGTVNGNAVRQIAVVGKPGQLP